MNTKLKFHFPYLLLFTVLGFISCGQDTTDSIEIRGIYGNPKPLWDKGYQLNELGVNAIFVHSGSINEDMINRARSEGSKVYAEFATLNGKNYVETHPEAWAINERGEKVEAATWFMGVCPTEPGFRKYRFDQLRDLLLEYDLDGIWMDYVHWHAQFEDPEPILPETCFCNHCLDKFSKDSKVEIPEGSTAQKAKWILNNQDRAWRNWRCKVIYDWTFDIKSIIEEIKPGTLLGLYHCPWNDEEFNEARQRVLGLDYNLLKKTIDVFSPMVYHKRMGRDPQWVQENIQWFSNELDIQKGTFPKIWPIVQAHNDPGIITTEQFETVLRGGLSGKSSGVMMFTTHSMAEDEGKTEVMKKVYSELKDRH
ncbi:family 10 glycosylhydrolase [Arenibacter sp. BSSL-BM3]|uniref:Family 10 glycosylhydrolase n=1 Tax=Arenibacter arenosicollis TaxID=2762274 RepID=A0ABR7QQE1_9FLAO|nr:family 10 glycosylhydrolase [Arenibacter arenosicollis]MBC8769304.1 family 10 glycosylhydrolase [Arenibacter arenosicollis]